MNGNAPAARPQAGMRRFKFIGCEIIYREACFLAATGPHRVDVEFLLKGLHDVPRQAMLERIQAAIDAVPAEGNYEAILLGYARCNDGVVGLKARNVPLVIPRAHDCITFFFGSRTAYQDYFERHPGTYFLSSGWSERNQFGQAGYSRPAYGMEGVMGKLGLAESYQAMVDKYGKENADFIIESVGGWLKNYSSGLYLEMGVCNEQPLIEQARQDAQEHGWSFDVRGGDWALLRKLFYSVWDEDFVVVQPGHTLVARNDEAVLDAE
ncbi:MAG: DUF1638 domain-containing protein [Candidatus Hydrogenedentes bacterium]|nr:DUF1638 domain-containing protein [Candidatus Hydrogenedentota bacterium]